MGSDILFLSIKWRAIFSRSNRLFRVVCVLSVGISRVMITVLLWRRYAISVTWVLQTVFARSVLSVVFVFTVRMDVNVNSLKLANAVTLVVMCVICVLSVVCASVWILRTLTNALTKVILVATIVKSAPRAKSVRVVHVLFAQILLVVMFMLVLIQHVLTDGVNSALNTAAMTKVNANVLCVRMLFVDVSMSKTIVGSHTVWLDVEYIG
jgi:hypothetical protein